ncbi:TetR/AcrR family transcriptional regulator C-terminal domain-containing protein [Paractinoplanes globisporus]|uniref:TetR/AcrR family transcriptional regulator C-terminal domain-containing protein n=1 Tax=Paractinoplanes globisporus TaxID=113565 RepID=A0ABW6WN80_9ACTN|nr:TetR/AcrR family transcriptional regulator C-terminal domain-containing protein [Actinoplanes globisporus]
MTSPERRKPGRPPIPRERIVDTALAIVDEHGADALTLRALADRLGASTATLYRHVSGRAELIGLVIDRMLGGARLPDEGGEWQVVLRDGFTAVFTTLTEHRRVAGLLVEQFPAGPNAIAFRERILGVLLRDGFSPDEAALTVATLGRFTLGFAMQSAAHELTREEANSAIDRGRYPDVARVLATVGQRPLGDEFGFGLTHLLGGLAASRAENAVNGNGATI